MKTLSVILFAASCCAQVAIPPTSPSSVTWSWLNQQGAVLASAPSGMVGISNANTPTQGLNSYMDAAAATAPFTLIAGIIPQFPNSADTRFGVLCRDSTTSRDLAFILGNGSGGFIALSKFTNETSWNGDYAVTSPVSGIGQITMSPLYLKIQDDGANLMFALGHDKNNFSAPYVVPRTDWLTGGCNQLGFFVQTNTASGAVTATVFDWSRSNP